MTHINRIFIVIFALLITLISKGISADDGDIHIAVISPKEVEPVGIKGFRLYMEEINWQTPRGTKITLDHYFDNNNKAQAISVAKQIAKDNRAALVIGHNYSSTSSVAGKIYAKHGIPAISYSATNPSVTKDNPWYFRTIFNDSSQGSFLAYYAIKTLNYNQLTVIYEPDKYGSFLAQVFQESAYEYGAKQVESFELDMQAEPEDRYKAILDKIAKNKAQSGLIFMATHADEGIALVKKLRDEGIKNPIMGPDSFYSTSFITGFNQFPLEQHSPGHYSNGIFVSAPIVFDAANAEAQSLKHNYFKTYGEHADWASAYGYDTAKVVESIIDISRSGKKSNTLSASTSTPEDQSVLQATLTRQRVAIREALASINSPKNAIKGATGLNYFNEDGDAIKPIFIAVLHGKSAVSGLIQYTDVPNIEEVYQLDEQIDSGHIIKMTDRFMYKKSVIFTGVKIHHIGKINQQKNTSELDFTLWFRYRGDFNPNQIEFTNSVDPLTLAEPEIKTESNNISYQAFRVKGVFRNNFMDDIERRVQVSIGFALRNTEVDRNSLLYISDIMGLGLTGDMELIDYVKKQKLADEISGWQVQNASIFERSINIDSLGLPQYINLTDATVPYSQYHYLIDLKQTGFRLSDLIDQGKTGLIAALCFTILSSIYLSRFLFLRRFKSNLILLRLRWLIITLSWVLLLSTSETWLSYNLFSDIDVHFQKWILHAYDLSWWIIPAMLLVHAADAFIWKTLQAKTGRPVPGVIQSLLAFIIYTLALFAIVAFVYDQKLTGLLATSGLLAMIIGLAIQMNLSNIFSGIALNLEQPFRVGDWVKIGEHEGQVIDVNWRATRLLTRVKHEISIPNTPAADTAIINYSNNQGATRQSLMVGVHPVHPIEKVKPLLIAAAFKHPNVLSTPRPHCTFAGIKEGVAQYRLIFSYTDYSLTFQVVDQIWGQMIQNFKKAGINYVPPMQRIEMNKAKPTPFLHRENSDFISQAAIFSGMPEIFKQDLSSKLIERHYDVGEFVLKKSTMEDSLFIIQSGVATILKENEKGISLEQQRLGIDDLINTEILYRDGSRDYSVRAVTTLRILEIQKEVLMELFQKYPEYQPIFDHNIQILVQELKDNEGSPPIQDYSKMGNHFAWMETKNVAPSSKAKKN